jgi:ABC-type hemin transport system ATPase subunit
MIEAKDVSVDIAGKPIVSGVDFHARPGEIAAIVGPNGSGKTTFLKALSGELAYTGHVALNGRDLSTMKPVEVAVHRAVLPQATTLSFPFTVREVVKLGLVGGRSGALVSSLDIKHQLIIMNIARDFARRGGGVVAILHDLNLTAMYAERIFVMHRGRLAATGSPQDVLSDDLIEKVFDCRLRVGVLPAGNMPFVLPQSAV